MGKKSQIPGLLALSCASFLMYELSFRISLSHQKEANKHANLYSSVYVQIKEDDGLSEFVITGWIFPTTKQYKKCENPDHNKCQAN